MDGSSEGKQTLWRRLWRSPARAVAAAVLGGAGAAAYAHFIGCRTGTCPLTSNAWVASLYGSAMGAIIGWPDRRQRAQERASAGRG